MPRYTRHRVSFLHFFCSVKNGDAKYPVKLPTGMASRHRLCTDMASKIKAMGYTGDCGYNQLLYPTELTTRSMLGFLVEKLPRADEEKEEILGANALLNRRILASLTEWSKAPFAPHCCPDFGPDAGAGTYQARFRVRAFRAQHLESGPKAKPVTEQVAAGEDAAPSLLERNCAAAVAEAALEAALEAGQTEEAKQAAAASSAAQLREAIAYAAGGGVGGFDGAGGGEGGKKGKASLAELLRELAEEAEGGDDGLGGGRGTRFTHATDFGQEAGDGTASAAAGIAGRGAGSAAVTDEDGGEGGEAEKKSVSPQEAARLKAEAEQRARDAELAALEASVAATEAAVSGGARAVGLLKDRCRQVEADLNGTEAGGANLEREVRVREKTLEMLPQAPEHIAKLQGICQASAAKLVALGEEWEKHRAPLVASLRAKRETGAARRARAKAMVEEMKRYRAEMQAMANEVRGKEEQAKAMADELSALPKNVNRTLYTYRIMDIINSIAKQKKEIEKIILEVQRVQKDINSTGERLSRAEALADEKIFSTAKLEANKKDVAMVDSYRLFSDIRARFDALVTAIEATGKRETETRDLEAKAEQLAERVSKNNTERILADLRQVQEENAGIVKELRAIKAAQQTAGV